MNNALSPVGLMFLASLAGVIYLRRNWYSDANREKEAEEKYRNILADPDISHLKEHYTRLRDEMNKMTPKTPEEFALKCDARNKLSIFNDCNKLVGLDNIRQTNGRNALEINDSSLLDALSQVRALGMKDPSSCSEFSRLLTSEFSILSVPIVAAGVALVATANSSGNLDLAMNVGGTVGAMSFAGMVANAISSRFKLPKLSVNKGLEKAINAVKDPSYAGYDLSRETLAIARNGFWVVEHPNLKEPAILSNREYGTYRRMMDRTDTPMIEVKPEALHVTVRRTVNGKLQSDLDTPAVVKFSRFAPNLFKEKKYWYDQGVKKDQSHFLTRELHDSPFSRANVREVDDAVLLDVLAPAWGKLERLPKVVTGESATKLIGALETAKGHKEREEAIYETLSVPSPDKWAEDYNAETGEVTLSTDVGKISIKRDTLEKVGKWLLLESMNSAGNKPSDREIHYNSSSELRDVILNRWLKQDLHLENEGNALKV